jgi:hypothetical protein
MTYIFALALHLVDTVRRGCLDHGKGSRPQAHFMYQREDIDVVAVNR